MPTQKFNEEVYEPGAQLTSPRIKSPTVMNLNGWIADDGSVNATDNVVWVFGDANHFAVAGNRTGRYNKGCRISYNDGAVDYGVVASTSFALVTPLTGVSTTVSSGVFNKTAHGLTNSTAVTLSGLVNTTGVSNYDATVQTTLGNVYFVVNSTPNTFKLASTIGGTAITLTGSDDGAVITVTGATVVALIPNADYLIAHATLTAPRHSYSANPQGYPGTFNWSATQTGYGTIIFSKYTFNVIGNTIWLHIYDIGTSTGSVHQINAPIISASGVDESWAAGFGLDNTSSNCLLLARVEGTAATIDFYMNQSFSSSTTTWTPAAASTSLGGWTSTGTTSHRVSLCYQF